jgi:hypothetical protein
VFLGLIAAAHYLYLVILSFVSTATLDGSARSILRVVQLVATTAVYFGAVHYYTELFFGPEAYVGLAQFPARIMGDYVEPALKLTYVPPLGMVVDYLYFSVVTMATIGYGDIHPQNMAKSLRRWRRFSRRSGSSSSCSRE